MKTLSMWLASAAALAALVAVGSVSPDALRALVQERGAVETLTVAFYWAAIVAAWLKLSDRKVAAAVIAVLLACVAREEGLRRPLLVLGAQAPPWGSFAASFFVAAVVLAAIAGAAWLVVIYTRRQRRPAVEWTLWTLAATLLVSQAFDRLPKSAGRAGFSVTPENALVLQTFEEFLEMMLPVLIVVAIAQSYRPPAAVLPTDRQEGAAARQQTETASRVSHSGWRNSATE